MELKRPLDGYSLYDPTALLTLYGLDLSCLRAALPALRPKDRRWYRDPKKHWHNTVFKP